MKKAVILLCFTLIVGSLYAQKVQNGVLTIPAGTTEIKGGAYYGMADIEKVVIPSSVTKIGDLAFHKCTGLKEIDIPASVKVIGAAAFQNCTSLTKVTLHEGLEKVDMRAFKNTGIRQISIPSTVKEIGREAFADCANLAEAPKATATPAKATATPAKSTTSSAPQSAPKGGMVYVEGGSFTMGDNNGREYEKPAHRVTVSSFYLCDHEVTQDEYVSVVGGFPYRMGHRGLSLPVEKTSWYDAVLYCNRRSVKEGLTPCYAFKGEKDPAKWGEDFTKFYSYDPYPHWELTCDWTANGYRLPTEAEWEWAARGGKMSRGYVYSGSNNLDEVAWYRDNADGQPHPVKQKKANELGLYDMTGNVTEWCWDWFATYADHSETNPKGYTGGFYYMGDYVYKAEKGGSYSSETYRCRPGSRDSKVSAYKGFDGMGFRVARNVPGVSYANSPERKNAVRPEEGFVLVEGGTFKMGNASGRHDQKPVHSETVGSFYMCDHEVTQGEFKEVMRINPGPFHHDNKPAYSTWFQAIIYCNLLSQARGLTPCYSYKGSTDVYKWETKRVLNHPCTVTNWDDIECDFQADGYRLPTEAEWEYAARGGKLSKGYLYSGSNNLDEVAWYAGTTRVDDEVTSYGAEIFHNEPREVKTKKPNELGLYDMSGNYYEWCWDWYKGYGEKTSTKLYRIIRGGGFAMEASVYTLDEAASYCTVAHRQRNTPNSSSLESDPGMGIRLVRTAK